jgi:hypothetical protein
MVCSYNCVEASGQDWGVTLATPKSSSPLQAIEKKRLKSVPNLKLPGPFFDGQGFGGNGKLLGNSPPTKAWRGALPRHRLHLSKKEAAGKYGATKDKAS